MPKLTRFQWQCATGPTTGERQAGNQADPELFGHHRVNRRHLLHHHRLGNRDAGRSKHLQDMTFASAAGHEELLASKLAKGNGSFPRIGLLRDKREPLVPRDLLTLDAIDRQRGKADVRNPRPDLRTDLVIGAFEN